jgi:hypothetical protein
MGDVLDGCYDYFYCFTCLRLTGQPFKEVRRLVGLLIFLIIVLIIVFVLAGGGSKGMGIVLYGIGLFILIGVVSFLGLVL